jgi:hypothetical protein
MKSPFISICSLTLLLSAHANAQTFKNGDFSKGASGWDGVNFKVEEDPAAPGNKVLAVELSKKDKIAIFGQKIRVKPGTTATVSFDVKPSPNFAGEGFKVIMVRPSGWIISSEHPSPPKEGKHIEFKFENDGDARSVEFHINVEIFVGKLYFDNFVVTP